MTKSKEDIRQYRMYIYITKPNWCYWPEMQDGDKLLSWNVLKQFLNGVGQLLWQLLEQFIVSASQIRVVA